MMVEPITFKPGPTQESIPRAPKETPPKRGGTITSLASKRSLKPEIAATLMQINLVLIMIPPLRKDQMDMVEIDALADALDDQARKSARFRKALEGALAVGSGGNLIGILAIIGARRAARHGMVPIEVDQQLGNLLAAGTQASQKARRDAGLA